MIFEAAVEVIDLAQDAPDPVYLAEDEAAFYGSLDLRTSEELVTRVTHLNAETTAHPLQQALARHPAQRIVVFWARASWHRGPALRALLAANPRLEIVGFPTGSPDLNPQEQVWKQTRRAVSHNHVTPKLPVLADRFEAHLKEHTFHSSFLEHYAFYLVCPFLN